MLGVRSFFQIPASQHPRVGPTCLKQRRRIITSMRGSYINDSSSQEKDVTLDSKNIDEAVDAVLIVLRDFVPADAVTMLSRDMIQTRIQRAQRDSGRSSTELLAYIAGECAQEVLNRGAQQRQRTIKEAKLLNGLCDRIQPVVYVPGTQDLPLNLKPPQIFVSSRTFG